MRYIKTRLFLKLKKTNGMAPYNLLIFTSYKRVIFYILSLFKSIYQDQDTCFNQLQKRPLLKIRQIAPNQNVH